MADGYIVYQGDAKASDAYFAKIGKPLPRFANPGDFFMKTLSINYPKKQEDDDKISELNRNYHAILEKSIIAENRMINLATPSDFGADGIVVNHKADTKTQLEMLMWRSKSQIQREPRQTNAKVFQTVVTALLMFGSFWQVNDYTTRVGVENMVGAIYYMIIVQMQLNF